MRIIKGIEPIPVDHPVFLLFAQPGWCKTSLGYSAKRPLLLDFDKGAHRAANRRDTLVIDSWEDVIELMASDGALDDYDTLVVDTVGRCIDVMIAHIAKTQPKLAPGGNPSLQGWGKLKADFRLWIASLRSLGKDVLLVAHDKEDKDGDTRIVRPDIAGGSYGEVFKVADFVGYGQIVGRNRVLDFNPTDRWVGKNPANWPPFQIPPVAKATTFMADLFDQGRDALGNLSDESAQMMRQVETWREKIAAFTTAQQFTDAIPLVNAIDTPMVQLQVKKLLLDTATAKSFTFDTKAKQFVEAKQPEAVGA